MCRFAANEGVTAKHARVSNRLYKVVQIWPGLFVCKQVTVCSGHIWTTLYFKYITRSCAGLVNEKFSNNAWNKWRQNNFTGWFKKVSSNLPAIKVLDYITVNGFSYSARAALYWFRKEILDCIEEMFSFILGIYGVPTPVLII